jgi:Fe-S cluster assembly protein SufB
VILKADNAHGEFRSVALTDHYRQAATGTRMIHLGKNTGSTISSMGISTVHDHNAYRGLVRMAKSAVGARNFSHCDSLLPGDRCVAHAFPKIEVKQPSAPVKHEPTTSRIGADQLFYRQSRGRMPSR